MQYPVFSCRVVASSYLFFVCFFVFSTASCARRAVRRDKRLVGRLQKIGSPFIIFITNSRLLIRSYHHLFLGGTTWHGPGYVFGFILCFLLLTSLFSHCTRFASDTGRGAWKN